MTDAPLGVQAFRRRHFLLRRPCVAGSPGGMAAAAPGSGFSAAPRLVVLLLVPLLWASAGVRAGSDGDLSHRNNDPPAPAQQLQAQPLAVQGPEPALAEVSWPGARGMGRAAAEPAAPGTGIWAPAGGGEPPCAPRTEAGCALLPARPGLAGFLGGWGRGPSREPAVNLGSRGPGCCSGLGILVIYSVKLEILGILIPSRKFLILDS